MLYFLGFVFVFVFVHSYLWFFLLDFGRLGSLEGLGGERCCLIYQCTVALTLNSEHIHHIVYLCLSLHLYLYFFLFVFWWTWIFGWVGRRGGVVSFISARWPWHWTAAPTITLRPAMQLSNQSHTSQPTVCELDGKYFFFWMANMTNI